MTTLDNNPLVDETTVPFIPTAVRIGLIGALVAIVFALISIISGLSVPTSIMNSVIAGLLSVAIYVGIGVFAVRKHRNEELGGYISFKRAFLVSFIAMFIAGVIGALFNVLYMNVIDPGYVDTVMEGMEEMFENLGVEGEMAEMQLEATRKQFEPTTQLTTGLLWGTLFGAVLSLIIAAVMKKNPPTL